MTDFRPDICKNLRLYPGIVARKEDLNHILNELDVSGFDKLVQNFCTQPDPERKRDFLFEIWICQMLRCNPEAQSLQYEPPDTTSSPDFRFLLQGVNFDIQVKRLHNTKNESTKLLFQQECEKRLSRIQKPWFINFWVSDDFTRQHLNPFFDDFLKKALALDQFSPVVTFNTYLGEPQYSWEPEGRTLVRFSFEERQSKESGIFPGVILMGTENGLMEPIDEATFRESVKGLLGKARKSLKRPVSSTQANLVVMQAVHDILSAEERMPDALYGDKDMWPHRETGRPEIRRAPNGLFRHGQFSNICGLILVPSQVWCFSEHFQGDYFTHPSHLQNIRDHPKPFEEMMFIVPKIGKN